MDRVKVIQQKLYDLSDANYLETVMSMLRSINGSIDNIILFYLFIFTDMNKFTTIFVEGNAKVEFKLRTELLIESTHNMKMDSTTDPVRFPELLLDMAMELFQRAHTHFTL